MLTKRIIPCLDVDKGRVVKGINFLDLIDAGNPVKLAKTYNDAGADELVFLDITASPDNRKTTLDAVRKVAKQVFIPFTVGGGIRTIEDISSTLIAGSDKASINSAAVKNPKLISDGANCFGSQCIVLAIDAKKVGDSWKVFINGGRTKTNLDAVLWAKTAVKKGAGEILLTSMDRDGTKLGFDIELTKAISSKVNVPVIASGGAGSLEDFLNIFKDGLADAALAASLFHFEEIKIRKVKDYLIKEGVIIRKC